MTKQDDTVEFIKLVQKVRNSQKTFYPQLTFKSNSYQFSLMRIYENQLDNYDTKNVVEQEFVNRVKTMRKSQKNYEEKRTIETLRICKAHQRYADDDLRYLFFNYCSNKLE